MEDKIKSYIKLKKYKKLKRLRKKRILKRITGISILLTFTFFTLLCVYKLYIKNRCKDLNYAVNYYLTEPSDGNSLARINHSSLVFSDTDTAVVTAYGLSKAAPHKKTICKGIFRRAPSNSWTLDDYHILENTN